MESATTTSVETATAVATSRRRDALATQQTSNGNAENGHTSSAPILVRRYRHVAAIHSKTRPSTLSHDADTAPSFLGFRNLMVIVLGMVSMPTLARRVLTAVSCGEPSIGH
jgi:diacylglycerol O-acyltransferase 1